MEEPIQKIITTIKKSRSRPCYQSILTLLNKGGKQLEMLTLKSILDELVKREIIICKENTEGREYLSLNDTQVNSEHDEENGNRLQNEARNGIK